LPQEWIIIFQNILSQGMGSASNFFPTIVNSLGFNATDTLLLTAPPYLFTCLYFFVMTWASDRYNQIYVQMMICAVISMIAYIIAISSVNTGARYFAFMFIPGASVGPQLLTHKTVTLHMSRPYKKRAACVALLNAIGGTSNIWGSYLWLDSPRFVSGFAPLIVFAVLLGVSATLYRYFIKRENQKLEDGDHAALAQLMRRGVTAEQIDMGWRYEAW
jgi:hypothetical protein